VTLLGDTKMDALAKYPNSLGMSSRFSMYVDPTEERITAGSTLDDIAAEPTDEVVHNSEIDENVKIIKIEKRDFDDVDRI
jgi:hypothetical protein